MEKRAAKKVPGLNVQWPWSQLILSGKKTVETRSYKLPELYLGKKLAIIETPGKRRGRPDKASIVGLVTFSKSFRYKSRKEWLLDRSRHLVDEHDPLFCWDSNREKWGWVISEVMVFQRPVGAPVRKGITFSKSCMVPKV